MLKIYFHDVGYADGCTSIGAVIAAGKKFVPEEIEKFLTDVNWERYNINDDEIGVVYEVSIRGIRADEWVIAMSNLKEYAKEIGEEFGVDLCIYPDFKRNGVL